MVDWIIEAVQWLWGWLLDVGSAMAAGIWSGVMSALPSVGSTSLDSFLSYLVVANKWLPFDALLASIAAYYGFLAVFVGTKFVLKLIPGLG